MKGLVIANCGAMGLNWERLSMSGYLEAMAARDPDYRAQANEPEVSDRGNVLRFHRARMKAQKDA